MAYSEFRFAPGAILLVELWCGWTGLCKTCKGALPKALGIHQVHGEIAPDVGYCLNLMLDLIRCSRNSLYIYVTSIHGADLMVLFVYYKNNSF